MKENKIFGKSCQWLLMEQCLLEPKNGTVRPRRAQCAALCGSVDVMYTEFFTSVSLLVFLGTEHRRRNWRARPPTKIWSHTTDNDQSLCYRGGSSSIGSSSVLLSGQTPTDRDAIAVTVSASSFSHFCASTRE